MLVKKKFTQKQLLTYTANLQTSPIGLEACSGAHFLGRALRKQGHDVRLIAAQFVKPFVKSNKNDFVDAEAIAEAVERKNMRFVPIKTDDQLDLQAIHRVRDRLVSRRTAVINQIRAFLLERGLVFGLCCVNSLCRGFAASLSRYAATAKTSKSLFTKRTSSFTCGLQVRQWPRRIIRITSNPLMVAAAVFIV